MKRFLLPLGTVVAALLVDHPVFATMISTSEQVSSSSLLVHHQDAPVRQIVIEDSAQSLVMAKPSTTLQFTSHRSHRSHASHRSHRSAR